MFFFLRQFDVGGLAMAMFRYFAPTPFFFLCLSLLQCSFFFCVHSSAGRFEFVVFVSWFVFIISWDFFLDRNIE